MPLSHTEKFFLHLIELGRISIDRRGIVYNHITERFIGAVGTNKYMKISIRDTCAGVIRHIQNHRLLWIHHNGEIPPGLQINHKDFNKLNNDLDNLELVTPKQNRKHAKDNGIKFCVFPKGNTAHTLRKNPGGKGKSRSVKISMEDIQKIRNRYRLGFSQQDLAKVFRVSQWTISCIVNKKGPYLYR